MRSALLRGRHDVGGWLRATHGPPPHRQLRSGHSRTVVVAMARPWRPDVNDVDRLSRGDGAKRRGTGSFHIPHRLNADERPVYETAKRRGYLAVRGSGYRKGRKGHPLPNAYRQWCDARGWACVVVEQDASGGSGSDVVVVDLAPLRSTQLLPAVAAVERLAATVGAHRLGTADRSLEDVPFNTMPLALPHSVEQLLSGATTAAASSSSTAALAPPTPEELQAAELAALSQADVVRTLKAGGLSNDAPDVQQAVSELLKRKAALQQLLDAAAAADEAATAVASGSSSNGSGGEADDDTGEASASGCADADGASAGWQRREVLPEDHPFAVAAIWQIPVMPLFFSTDRSGAKTLAKALADELCGAQAAARAVRI